MRHDRHAGAKHPVLAGQVVEDDLDRHPLHDLHVIAGGVFRWQQRKGGAAPSLETVDAAVKNLAGIGVYVNIDRVADLDIRERSVSLKLAVIQTSSGTRAIKSWPT